VKHYNASKKLVLRRWAACYPNFPPLTEMTRDLQKSRSSLLKHIFSTIPAFTPPSTQNWVSKRSGCPGVDVEKI
jgi:hypothetical protein